MARPPGHYSPNPRDRQRQRAAELRQLLQEQTPCQSCRHRSVCAEQFQACTVFARWTATGSWLPGLPRVPSEEVYAKLFSTQDED